MKIIVKTKNDDPLGPSFFHCKSASAHDHADFALVPDVVKGGGVFPVLVGLAAVVVVVRIADEVAARWVVAVDKDGVVVVDEALQLAVDPVVAVAWLFPPEGFVGDDHVAGEEFLAQFFHRGAAEVGADAGTVAVGVAVFSEGSWVDGGTQGIVDHVWRADKAPLRIGRGERQVVEIGGHMHILGVAEGFEPHESADRFAANPGVDAVDLADVWYIAHLIGTGSLGEDAVGIGLIGADGFVEGKLAVAVDAVKLAGDVVDTWGEGVVGEVDAAPGFAAAAAGLFMGDRGFGDGDGSPVFFCDVGVEAESHEGLGLGAVAIAAGDAVDDGAGFGTGEAVVRTEGAVFVAADPAEAGGDGDLFSGPVVGRDIAEAGAGAGLWCEAHDQVDDFGTGDGVVWSEGGAVVKETEAAEGAHVVGKPVAVLHIGVGAGAAAAVGVFKQTINDRGCFSAGDLAFRTHAAVFVTAEVAHMGAGEGGIHAASRIAWFVRLGSVRIFRLRGFWFFRQRRVGVAAAGGFCGSRCCSVRCRFVVGKGRQSRQRQHQTKRCAACRKAFENGVHDGSLLFISYK